MNLFHACVFHHLLYHGHLAPESQHQQHGVLRPSTAFCHHIGSQAASQNNLTHRPHVPRHACEAATLHSALKYAHDHHFQQVLPDLPECLPQIPVFVSRYSEPYRRRNPRSTPALRWSSRGWYHPRNQSHLQSRNKGGWWHATLRTFLPQRNFPPHRPGCRCHRSSGVGVTSQRMESQTNERQPVGRYRWQPGPQLGNYVWNIQHGP